MASDIWEVIKYIHYFELFPVCLFIFRMTCIKYKVCSQYTVYIHPPTPHPQRPFISEDEILTYISGILQKKIIPNIIETVQHMKHTLFCAK